MLYLASLDSGSYTWRAIGNTEQEARDLVHRAFIDAAYAADEEYAAELFEEWHADAVNVYPLEPGRALRDDSVILEPEPAALGVLEPPAWEGVGGVPVMVALNTDGSLTIGTDLSEILEALDEDSDPGMGDEVRAAITAALEANPGGYYVAAHVNPPTA